MKLIPQQKLNKALDKALLKHRPFVSEIELFKTELIKVLDHTDPSETEEFHKNLVSTFLTKAFYANTHFINTKGRQDLVIHTGKDNKHSVGVIIEAKRPANKADWFTADKPNSKALQELVLYYLRERIEAKNIDIKYLIATNINEWYIIEASYFDKLFYHNKQLVKQYEEWRDGKKVTKDTGLFYNEIAKPFIENLNDEIPCTYFNIKDHEKALRSNDSESNKDLNALFKILSPYHLLKVPFANDSNELNDKFYKELLHIIGLEEAKEGGKNIIRRKVDRNNASLLEKAIDELKTEGLHKIPDLKSFGDTTEDQYFNIALELCITWINRILFLKLLEGQLINYHKGDQQYRFLNSKTINDFDELFKLFHKVLAIDVPNRNATIQQKYSLVPYLNSSLFEISDLEDVTIKINAIDSNDILEYIGITILKDQKKKGDKLNTLDYLFQFLDAYDFASEGTGDTQEDNKTLINASVLGKVFEKINGYKDGSIYTPGFITMYMSRQSIRLAVLQKFNDAYGWDCKDFADLDNYIEYQQPEARNKANFLINDLKLCDPAVGSGHFLVSALNEIIAIKSELKILQDVNGKRLKEYSIDVVNDELIVTDEDNDLFIYNPQSAQSQLIQQTLFTEKQTIIENCLFGVDINPNSVKICRLRLWIELLKNAYYKPDGYLETLPNIDINIKCGNSLLSRFALDADLSKALKSIKYDVSAYRGFVNDYKNCKDREVKRGLQLIIDKIKADFRTEIAKNDPLVLKLNKASGELYNLLSQVTIFEEEAKIKKANKIKQEKLELDINKWTKEVDEIKNNAIYKNAFEWRFEFPEVLNNNGDFEGFDLLIANPPYIQHRELAHMSNYLKSNYTTYSGTADISTYFFEVIVNVLKTNGVFSVINSNKFFNAEYGKKLRAFLSNYNVKSIINFEQVPIFEAALVSSAIFVIKKEEATATFNYSKFFKEKVSTLDNDSNKNVNLSVIKQEMLKSENWLFNELSSDTILDKIKSKGVPISNDSSLDIKRGITTGFDEAFLINESTKEQLLRSEPSISNVIKPLLKGKDIHKYFIKNNALNLLFVPWHFPDEDDKTITGSSLNAEKNFKIKLPSLYSHLEKYKDQLSKRNVDETGIRYEWYALQRCANTYYDDFYKEKIIWGLISGNWGFAYDDKGHFLTSASFFLTSNIIPLKFILGLFNSQLFRYYFTKVGEYTAGGAYVLKKTSVEKFVIPLVNISQQNSIISLVDAILKLKEQGNDTLYKEQQIDDLVYQLYDLTPEEIATVERV